MCTCAIETPNKAKIAAIDELENNESEIIPTLIYTNKSASYSTKF